MAIEIRQARTLDSDAVQRFIGEAYGPLAPFKGVRRWEWQFVRNPFFSGGPDAASVWLAWDGDEVVGQTAVQHGRCWIGGQPHDFGWIVDVMILARYRGQGLGHRIYDAIARSVPTTFTLTMAAATRKIAERQGAVTLPPVHCLFRPQRCKSELVRRFVSAKAADSARWQRPRRLLGEDRWRSGALAASINLIGRVAGAARRRPRAEIHGEVVEVERFDSSIDRLSEALAGAYDVVCVRSSEYMNWRFVDVPDLCYRRFIVREGTDVLGVLVTREPRADELPLGIICELFTMPGAEGYAQTLLDHASNALSGMQGLVAGASAPETLRLLRERGFLTIKRHYPTVVTNDESVRAACARPGVRAYFSKGDHDWDQVHLA